MEILNERGKSTSDKLVSLDKLDVQTKIVGNLANTIVTMTFKNNSNRVLEGRLTFPLPEGISISGFALDVNGKLRDAVPVEKAKAKEVFESVERRKVDPGIIEKVENSFRTRIYPIPANGTRMVQVQFNENLKSENGQLFYNYVFSKDVVIPKFDLKVQVFDEVQIPTLEQRPDGDFNFVKQGNAWTAEISKTNFKTKDNLKVYLDQDLKGKLISQAASGSYYFLLNVPMQPITKARTLPKTLGLIWDNSLSMSKRNLEKELKFLEAYFNTNRNVKLKLVLLNNKWENAKDFQISNGNFSELKQYLSTIQYDGGTDFSQLKNIEVDEYLFFTDGISGFGDLKMNLTKPTFCVTSNVTSNFSQLQFISRKTGGEFINLASNDVNVELNKVLKTNLKFLGIKPNSSISELYPSSGKNVGNNINIVGISNTKNTKVVLLFGYDNQVSEEKVVDLDFEKNATSNWNIAQVWAQNKIEDLELQPKENADEIRNLGKQFGIVTSNTSLIVLESLDDYVKYSIVPPAELRKNYDEIIKNKRNEMTERRVDIMKRAEETLQSLKEWWNTDFSRVKKYPKVNAKEVPADVPSIVVVPDVAVPVANESRPKIDSVQTKDIESVVVTASGISRKTASYSVASYEVVNSANVSTVQALEGHVAGLTITNSADEIKANIKTIDVKSTAEYMKYFQNLNSAKLIYQEYLKLRKSFAETPSYYFDVANLLFNLKEKELGLRVLSSITDLDLENEELYKLVLYQLKKQGINDKSVFIAKKILEWRPMDPQSYRDYALALEDDGQYQEALAQLYKVFTNDYTEEIADRDFEIEETVLMELNELINHRKANPKDINPKLIAELPVNIRVVLNWNKDNTDIDLWVTDPSGEKCMYSNKNTAVGGRLSDDFMGGFGPEQFILKKAIKGKYKIETDFYGEQQASISGPTTLMAEIFLNYASGKQERKIVVFQSDKKGEGGNNNGILVAEFEY
ncbi:VIT domain-containing protein [Soonwooa sp.]|uniref:VIT domain-containing protein n=1 Tax=Soonwooa sp. TaxID=1938592 RepID=UPI00260DDEFC|nr:VIT domain-containing protein [Soonwooa sp.]